jgi:hypothetical protein
MLLLRTVMLLLPVKTTRPRAAAQIPGRAQRKAVVEVPNIQRRRKAAVGKIFHQRNGAAGLGQGLPFGRMPSREQPDHEQGEEKEEFVCFHLREGSNEVFPNLFPK